jgi:hypothetical protein
MVAISEPMRTLADRGIAHAAELARWEPFTVKGRAGWAYPVLNSNSQPYPERRWKSADGSAPKYLWLWEKPSKAKYYFLPGFFSAIEQNNGNCWLSGGEPDVLAFSEAGIQNAFCWLDGEGSPPASLADDLARMGVTLLMYPADRDLAGAQSAYKVSVLLDNSPVMYIPFALPAPMGSKYDINNLWLDKGQDAIAFKQALDSLNALDLVTMSLYAKQTGMAKQNAETTVTNQIEAWRQDWQNDIIRAMGTPAVIENRRERWHCPLPGHDDRHPSFRFSDDQKPGFVWPVCSCGIQERSDPWGEVAAALNVDSWSDYKALKAAEAGYIPPAKARTSLPLATTGSEQIPSKTEKPLWIDMHDEYRKLKRELMGEIQPDIQPFVFPLSILHHLGGFARFSRRKKVTLITGVSGGGKTLLLKTMMLGLMRLGYDVIWWGPEWTPSEYAEQDLQRVDGMSMEILDEWRIWKYYESQGLDVVRKMSAQFGLARPGKVLIDKSGAKMDELINIPGHMYVIPDFEMPLADVCNLAKGIATLKRREGRDVLAFAFDYVQLAQAKGQQDWKWAEQVVGEIKAHVGGGGNMHCFVSAQVRKADSEKVRSGETLTQGSAQGLSDAQANLYLTLTPEVEEDGKFKSTGWLKVVKNSSGRTGKVRVYTDWQHLSVLDREVKAQTINVNAYTEPLDPEAH